MGKLGWAKGNGHKGRNGLDNLMPTTRPKFDLNYIAGVNQKILQVLESKKHKVKEIIKLKYTQNEMFKLHYSLLHY